MFKAIKEFFFGKAPEQKAEVPYKVEAPVTSSVAEKATQAVVESVAPTPAGKKKSGGKKPQGQKPQGQKPAGSKKPRGPRKTKSQA